MTTAQSNNVANDHPEVSASAGPLPTTIRCLLQPSRLHPTLTLTRTPLQLPRPNSADHLIRVAAVSPCRDELTWAVHDASLMHPDRIDIPCFDVSGTVVTAPPGSPFQPGTKVFAHTDAFTTGNARDYTIAETRMLARVPEDLSFQEAASVPLSALTAWQALFVHGGLTWGEPGQNAGKRLLITAAAGGVGVWAVQLARIAGVGEVLAVCGSGNAAFVKGLGATRVLDYREKALGEWVREMGEEGEVDLVVDMVGGRTLGDAWGAVREGGLVVSVVEREPEKTRPEAVAGKGIRSKFFILESDGGQLEIIAGLLEVGKARAVVDSVWDMEQYQEAFAKLEDGHARGKIVIKIGS